jgi:nitrite reductase/ring-hydroxylating ferredoxin subunit
MPRIAICESAELTDCGAGVRFEVMQWGRAIPAFAIRFRGQVHGYINRCAHVPIELDWNHGEFFDAAKLYLICSTHGALYAPETGRCVGGPCRGASLEPVALEEADGIVWRST